MQNPDPLPLISTVCEKIKDQADALGEHFEHASSSAHYSKKFLDYKKSAEQQSMRESSNSREEYNCRFSLQEIKAALCAFDKSAPGADRITYEMIKHLNEDTLEAIRFLFNKVWSAGRFLRAWKEEIGDPILKEGK